MRGQIGFAGVVVWIVMSQRAGTPAPQVAAAAPADTVGYAYGGGGDYTPTTALPQPPVPPAPPRERSYLGLIGLFAAMAASGLAILFGAGATVVLAAALLALGVTMLVGAFVGRAKWLLIFAIPLLMLLSAVAQVERAERKEKRRRAGRHRKRVAHPHVFGELRLQPGDRGAFGGGVAEQVARGEQPVDLGPRGFGDRLGVIDVGRADLSVCCHVRQLS